MNNKVMEKNLGNNSPIFEDKTKEPDDVLENFYMRDSLNKKIERIESALREEAEELNRIYESRSWRALSKIRSLKKNLLIWIKKTMLFPLLLFLLALSVLTNLYLSILKKLRGTIIFPGN